MSVSEEIEQESVPESPPPDYDKSAPPSPDRTKSPNLPDQTSPDPNTSPSPKGRSKSSMDVSPNRRKKPKNYGGYVPTVNISGKTNRNRSSMSKTRKSQVEINPNVRSSLTSTLVNTIVNDNDASKYMGDDVDHIIALQLSPQLLSHYKFKNHHAMVRMMQYGSDIPRKKDLPTNSHLNDDSQSVAKMTSELDESNQTEPLLSTNLEYRRKLRQKVRTQMIKQEKQENEEEIYEDGDRPLSPLEIGENERADSAVKKDLEATKSEVAKSPPKNTRGKPGQGPGNAGQANPSGTITRDNQMQHTQSPFAAMFSDPDRHVKHSTFSPFSSKVIPSKQSKEAKHMTEEEREIAALEEEILEESEDEDDGDDFFIPAEETRKKGKQKRIGRSIVDATFTKKTNAPKQKPVESKAMKMTGVKLYKSQIREEMEDTLMGAVPESDNEGEAEATQPMERSMDRQHDPQYIPCFDSSGKARPEWEQTQMGMSGTRRRRMRRTHPMMLSRSLEPGNERATDDGGRELEDATLQKYTHCGIQPPSSAVTQFQRFMVETKNEQSSAAGANKRESEIKKTNIMKRYNEKLTNQKKHTRVIPASGQFKMEVRKVLGGGSKKDDEGKEDG
ncbi:hypothetical protein BLNAU_23206 [Blattamonas nauphoetae]|uniref:Uncharacterized protein n=1 Tax=Blattamonas nauphoetae TaxID=2049346 RepID=A0ABQ9WQW5_9EUKA|nr:hypothetical protein BLNAU_23206 [Blattamonas nauphoetae]